MPRVKLSPEFKKAVEGMSPKEKDKLLFRLLPKEPALVEKLSFQLLEDGSSTEERRDEVKYLINNRLEKYEEYFYTPGYLQMELRTLSGEITRHVKTTKDKYGEVMLNLFMLNKTMELYNDEVMLFHREKTRTFNEYVVKRTLKIYALLEKLHEDYLVDFKEDMQTLGIEIGKNDGMMKVAIQNMLDVNWLLKGILPDY